MALCDVQFVLQTASGIPEDFISNTWHMDDGEADTYSDFVDAVVVEFYQAIAERYSDLIVETGHTWKAYKISDPEPRAPVDEGTWSLGTAPTGDALPPEVSCVLSYHGTKVSGEPAARRRGRVYLGPLAQSEIAEDGRLTNALVTDVRNAGAALLAESEASSTWKWATHSRVDNSGVSVTGGWVDNEPDTQRRRGRIATVRNTF